MATTGWSDSWRVHGREQEGLLEMGALCLWVTVQVLSNTWESVRNSIVELRTGGKEPAPRQGV